MSSRSSILRSALTLSRSETGGSVYSPLRRSAGAFVIGSGSGSGSDGATNFGGLAGANDRGPPAAADAAVAADAGSSLSFDREKARASAFFAFSVAVSAGRVSPMLVTFGAGFSAAATAATTGAGLAAAAPEGVTPAF